ncbi:MAG: hypothetical protein HN846_00250 [Candidatus Pacebacteria bacterium]|jgi:hypothetical protein|nr:hypothetical protein [Candidatus Paceibacterota bacterium]MBT3511639.1 hypothetical protein [Candidatus Paceibacterota bacterium]MBT4004598.1 hypothetical protein [Candidatus Paceibacterota bacterium]MBT4358901.1 hypothetical protein [Candidatus Paceibacterota bacterium]MBT4681245.1 hypothetical protein [Candidatus Paceibacterota bacterium]
MRLKTYWHILSNLLTSPKYYLEILQTNFWLSFRFFAISMLILGITLALKINSRIIPNLQNQLNKTLDEVLINYPADLEITWDEDHLKYSIDKPLAISYPSFIEKEPQLPPFFGYLIPRDISIENLSEELVDESMFIISTQNLFINNLQGVWASNSLTDILPQGEIAINKDTIIDLTPKAKQELENLILATKQLSFIIVPFGLIALRFWMSFLEAILLLLFFKLNRLDFSFKKIIQLSLYLMVVAEIITQLTSWIYPDTQVSMLAPSYWIIFSYIFWTQRKKFSKSNIIPTHQE